MEPESQATQGGYAVTDFKIDSCLEFHLYYGFSRVIERAGEAGSAEIYNGVGRADDAFVNGLDAIGPVTRRF